MNHLWFRVNDSLQSIGIKVTYLNCLDIHCNLMISYNKDNYKNIENIKIVIKKFRAIYQISILGIVVVIISYQ